MNELWVFSPSSTVTFAQCPRKWALHREGWKTRLIQYPELCAVLGDGFSSAMHFWNSHRIGQESVPPYACIDVGIYTMQRRLELDIAAGRRIDDKDQKTADLLDTYLEKAVHLYVDANPLKDWTLLAAEETYPAHGHARLDLRASDVNGIAVFDYKVKVKLESKWEAKTLDEYAHSQQRYHYQWMAGTKRFFIVLVVLGPKPYVKVCPYGASTYFDTGLWLKDSKLTWQQMEYAKRDVDEYHISPLRGAPTHHDQYGPCEYQEACLEMGLDTNLMNVSYVKMERKPHTIV